MPVKLLIFDLDGTLVDTRQDITSAINYALEPYGFKKVDVDETTKLIGEGVSRLFEKLIGNNDSDIIEDVKNRFLDYYSEHIADYSTIYPNVIETLEKLIDYKKAIISNKREELTKKLLKKINIIEYFDIIVGSDTTPEKKPSPLPILYACSNLNVQPKEAIIIGDSNYDIEAGKKAGVFKTIGVTYGYRDLIYLKDADYIISSFDMILPILDTFSGILI